MNAVAWRVFWQALGGNEAARMVLALETWGRFGNKLAPRSRPEVIATGIARIVRTWLYSRRPNRW